MGWANCGQDSKGRHIGYAHDGTCDEPGCTAQIHRGLAYACGGMHGEDELSCEGYFCEAHRVIIPTGDDRKLLSVCFSCCSDWRHAYPEAAQAWDAE